MQRFKRWVLVLLSVAAILGMAGVVTWLRPDPPMLAITCVLAIISFGILYLVYGAARYTWENRGPVHPMWVSLLIALRTSLFTGRPANIFPVCILTLVIITVCVVVPNPGSDEDAKLITLIRCVIPVVLISGYILSRLFMSWYRRRAVDRIVIGQIAAVVRQNLPLGVALSLAAESERGAARRGLRSICTFVEHGVPLSEAIRLGYPGCASMAVSLILAGEQAGQLPAALEQAEEYLKEQSRQRDRVDIAPWPYGLVVMGFTGLVVSGMMIAVVPKFKEIFLDFRAHLPRSTVALINISEWFVQGTPPGWVFLVPLLVALPVGFYLGLRPRKVPDEI